MQRSITAEDALDVLAVVGALHDAPDPAALLTALPRLVGDLIPHDTFELLGAAGSATGPVSAADHRLAVPTPDAGGVLTGLLLGRSLRPFGGRDAAIAGLLGPAIGAAADHVRLKVLRTGGELRLRGLTVRERQVLSLVADGRSTRDIALALFIECRTVEKHVEHIKAKLGAHSRAEAAAAWARSMALAS